MSARPKILYVDDEPLNLELFEMFFKAQYDVLTARDGFEGLLTLRENPSSALIISDMRMPRMSGLEFIKQAKVDFPEKKFYILTGYGLTKEIQLAIDAGLVQYCFGKPFNVEEISLEIKTALS
jgi:two-component system, response regulator, stage 0 sporulation protein F